MPNTCVCVCVCTWQASKFKSSRLGKYFCLSVCLCAGAKCSWWGVDGVKHRGRINWLDFPGGMCQNLASLTHCR